MINKSGTDITFISLSANRKLLIRNKGIIDFCNELFEDLVSLDLSEDERVLANELLVVKLLNILEGRGWNEKELKS